jgi:hypothetical protein
MALQGDLSEFSLPDIIQLVDLSQKTGGVHIRGQRGSQELDGWIYFRDGKIIDATLGDLAPIEAAYTFFTCMAGPFQFYENRQPPKQTISQSNEMIIMEGIGRQDSWAQIQEYVPSLQMVPKLVLNPTSSSNEISLEADEWRVLTMVNGRSTVAQIAERSGLGEMRTCQIIADLLRGGLIEKKELSLRESLFPELERIATESIGSSARVLLQDAYRRAGIADLDHATREQVVGAINHFEAAIALLLGPQRVQQIVAGMRAYAQQILS